MDENQIEGGARNFGGKVQEAVGNVLGDAATQARGKANQAAGQAQQGYGQAVDELRGFTTEQPITALLTALGLGVALGWLLRR